MSSKTSKVNRHNSKRTKNNKPKGKNSAVKRGKSKVKYRKKLKLKRKVKKALLRVLSVVLLSLATVSYSSNILNPFVGVKGLFLMVSTEERVIKLSDSPLRYISDSFYELTLRLRDEGYTVIPLEDRAFELRKDDEIHFIQSANLFGLYEIFNEVYRADSL